MFEWTEEIMAFRADAMRINRTEAFLAHRIAAYLPQGAHICDAGCGMGALSMELAGLGFSVTAIDQSAAALGYLRRQPMDGLRILQGDFFAHQPEESYDALVFCFFGKTDETLRAIARQCRGRAILIKKDWATHRFDMQGRPLHHSTYRTVCRELAEQGIPFETEQFTLQMGQPLRSVADGVRFFAAYDPEGQAPTPEEVAARLAPHEGEFPLYFPSECPLGMLILNADDVRRYFAETEEKG